MGEECIQEAELRNLLEKKPIPIAYDGFEPSGRMHIAQVCVIGVLLKPAALLKWPDTQHCKLLNSFKACTSVASAEAAGLLMWPAKL